MQFPSLVDLRLKMKADHIPRILDLPGQNDRPVPQKNSRIIHVIIQSILEIVQQKCVELFFRERHRHRLGLGRQRRPPRHRPPLARRRLGRQIPRLRDLVHRPLIHHAPLIAAPLVRVIKTRPALEHVISDRGGENRSDQQDRQHQQ